MPVLVIGALLFIFAKSTAAHIFAIVVFGIGIFFVLEGERRKAEHFKTCPGCWAYEH